MPFEQSLAAHYISRYDPWYRRHVHSTFYYKNFMPDDNYMHNQGMTEGNRQEKNKNKDDAVDKKLLSYVNISPRNLEYCYLNKAMQHYFTFAMQNLKVPIYKVSCRYSR